MKQGYSPRKKGVSSPWSHFIATILEFSARLPGPRSAAWLERDHRVMSPSYTRVYPLVVRRARGAMVEDMDRNRFLDFTAGIAVTNVGHSHPAGGGGHPEAEPAADPHVGDRFLLCAPGSAGRATGHAGAGTGRQARLLHQQRGRGDRGRAQAGAAAHRQESGPGVPGRISRANLRGDVAFRLQAHAAAGASRPWFPRSTTLAMAISRACTPCCARSARPTSWRRSSSNRSRARAATSFPRPISCRVCGRFATSTRSCWCSTRFRADSAGRAELFASEHWDIEGDIICLAKGIANGLPLGAIVARASVMDWPSGSHASTFGGNPVACAAALASLRLIETRYRANSEVRGDPASRGAGSWP